MSFFGRKKKENHHPPKESKPAERRFLPRWKINTAAKIRWEGQDQYVEAVISDINLKGVSLNTETALPSHLARLTLYFNELCFFTADIYVESHAHKGQMHTYNIRFTRIYDDDREKLCKMIRQNFPDQLKIC